MLKASSDKRQPFTASGKKSHGAGGGSLFDVVAGVSNVGGGSLEVVSQERFQQQLEGMSSSSTSSSPYSDAVAADRRDAKGEHGTWQQPAQRMVRSARGKRNMPIVVCLRETIRAYSRVGKGRPASATAANRRTVSESSAAVIELPRRIAADPQPPPSAPPVGKKASKNFSAFLSAVERAHAKDRRFMSSAQNVHGSRAAVTCPPQNASELNNSFGCHHQTEPAICPSSDASQSLRNRDNIDVIHNDLRDPVAPADLNQLSDDQSEPSDDSCSSRQSTTESDSEPVDESRTKPSASTSESSTYSVSPQDCPQCLAAYYAYTHYYALGSKYFKIEVVEDDETEAGCFTRQAHTEPSSPTWSSDQVFSTGEHRHIDVVSLDLTGSDVTFTIEQHSTTDSASDNNCSTSSSCPEFIHNFYCTMFGFVPCVPGYCFVPAFYFTFPMWSVPKSADKLQHQQHSRNSHHSQPLCTFRPSLPPAPQRPWITLKQPDKTRPIAIFTVMCYNVLCDKYATRQLYGYCPSWALNWQHRKRHIFDEIHQYGADIISLQEVETEQFYSYFLPELQVEGYDGIFAPKSRARTVTEAERKHVDGCAIFYRQSKFCLVSEHLIEFNQLAIEAAKGSHDMINRVMTKDNIGLAALLETKDAVWENGHLVPSAGTQQQLLVATCHIHWDPDYSDVKLIQTMMLMNELKNITEMAGSLPPVDDSAALCSSIPLILCGDFNSLPDSGVVEFLNNGQLSTNHKDFKDIVYENSLHKLSVSDNKQVYSHAFQLAQAYTADVMPYTNYTSDFKGIIDYMFYSKHTMLPLGLLGSFDINWFQENRITGCPNPQIPSDHLPLLVEFEMYANRPT